MKIHSFVMACMVVGFGGAGAVFAGPVDSACMRADRKAAPGVCNCIQRVADQTLNRSDQRRAAEFFRNPDEAQEVRMSPTQADNDFWARYKSFVATAESYCTS